MVGVVLLSVNKIICQTFQELISPAIKHNLWLHEEAVLFFYRYLRLNWTEKAYKSEQSTEPNLVVFFISGV